MINLELTKGTASVMYSILVDANERAVAEGKSRRLLNKDGSVRKNRTVYNDYDRYLLDVIEVSDTFYKYLEPVLDERVR